jgi:hypothetical protein
MKWEIVNITDKIHILKELMDNTATFDIGDEYIVNALITGSRNDRGSDDDYGFDIQPHHLTYMRTLWDTAIENQIDDSVIQKIKLKMRERG